MLRGEVGGDQLLRGLWLDQQPRLGVGVEQGRQPLDVDVVGVLVGHDDASRSVRSWKPGENVPGSMRIRWSPVSTSRQAWPNEVMRMPTNYAAVSGARRQAPGRTEAATPGRLLARGASSGYGAWDAVPVRAGRDRHE